MAKRRIELIAKRDSGTKVSGAKRGRPSKASIDARNESASDTGRTVAASPTPKVETHTAAVGLETPIDVRDDSASGEVSPTLPPPDLSEGVSIAAAPRRTRKTKAVTVESAGKESLAKLAPVIIGMMQMAGSVVSDQADMTGLEQTLIITGLESLPSEQMEKALKIMGPLSLVAGSGMYFIRVMTHRRPPPGPVKRDPPPNPHTNPPTNGASIVTEQPTTGGIPTSGEMPLANPFVSSIPINTNGTSH